MSETEQTSDECVKVEEKAKPKYYNEKHKEYMRKYRAKYGSYTEVQKKAIKKYTDRIKQEAKLYRELTSKGVVSVE